MHPVPGYIRPLLSPVLRRLTLFIPTYAGNEQHHSSGVASGPYRQILLPIHAKSIRSSFMSAVVILHNNSRNLSEVLGGVCVCVSQCVGCSTIVARGSPADWPPLTPQQWQHLLQAATHTFAPPAVLPPVPAGEQEARTCCTVV